MSGYFWRIWAVLFVLSIFWLGLAVKTSQPAEAQSGAADVVRAEAFEVVDADGEVRAALITHPDGSPTLRLYDASGEIRAELSTRADGAAWLGLTNASGEARAVLGTFADGSPGLWLHDASGRDLFSAP